MGSCLCRENLQRDAVETITNQSHATSTMLEPSGSVAKRPQIMEPSLTELLIHKTLRCIGTYQLTGVGESPAPLLKLHMMADTDEGWYNVMICLVRTIPLNNPLGPSAITIIFDDSPLPAHDTVVAFLCSFELDKKRAQRAYVSQEMIRQERNLLVMLGSIGEKFASVQTFKILDESTVLYLLTFLTDARNPNLVLHALLALEKFARSAENKEVIEKAFAMNIIHPLLPLETHHDSHDYTWRQVGFCARWALDNIFVLSGRSCSFETVTNIDINAILNWRDVSEYLKISADGLEARCDSHSFESIRGSFQIDDGCWYYEAEVITDGVMQIGWATKKSAFQNHEGYGVGDDSFSLAYDGCRRLVWYKAEAEQEMCMPSWQPGDVLGCLIDVNHQEAVFSLNGECMSVCTNIFANCRIEISDERRCSEGFFAAASFMAFQQCRFNFGHRPFLYPPKDREFASMNERGNLTSVEKVILPRRHQYESMMGEEYDPSRRCSVCYDNDASYAIETCHHGLFCARCIKKLEQCPICRCKIQKFYLQAL